jgi:hypothetical protein
MEVVAPTARKIHISNVKATICTGTTHAATSKARRSTAPMDALATSVYTLTLVHLIRMNNVSAIIFTGTIRAGFNRV